MNTLALLPLEVAQVALAIVGGGLVAMAILAWKKLTDPWRARMAEEARIEKERAEAAHQQWLDDAPKRAAEEDLRRQQEEARLASLPPPTEVSGLCVGGWMMLAFGVALLVYFLAVYDVGVDSGGAHIANAARLQDRLAGIIIGVVIAFSGLLCLIADQVKPTAPKPANASHAALTS